MYTESSKKYGELKSLYKDLKDQFEINGVKPVKSTDGTRWIDYKVGAMVKR